MDKMKKILLFTMFVLISVAGFSQRYSTIISRGDTIATLSDTAWVAVWDEQYGELKAIRLKHAIELYGGGGSGGAVTSVNGQTGVVILDTDDISEGSNLYNQTHTGDVTGSIVLTIADGVIEAVNLESTNSPTDNYVPSYDASSGGFTWVENAGGGGSGTVTSISAGDGMDFTDITTTGSITMGTPSTLTGSTGNSAIGTGHSHAITTTSNIATAGNDDLVDAQGVRSYVADSAINPNDAIDLTPIDISFEDPLYYDNSDSSVKIYPASTSRSGAMPQLSGTATEYLNGSGAWTTPSGGGGSGDDTARVGTFIVEGQWTIPSVSEWVTLTDASVLLSATSGGVATLVGDSMAIFTATGEGINKYDYRVHFHNPAGTQIGVTCATRLLLNSVEVKGSGEQFTHDFSTGDFEHLSSSAYFNVKAGDTVKVEIYCSDADIVLSNNTLFDNNSAFIGSLEKIGVHSDQTAPTMTFEVGNYDDSIIVASASEFLDTTSTTAIGEWTVSQGSTYATVSNVVFSENYDSVLIGLSEDASIDSTYLASYSGTGILDYARNYLATFTDSSVTNNIAAASVDTFNINFTQTAYQPVNWVNLINNITTPYTIDGSMTITAQGSYSGGESGTTGGFMPDSVGITYHYGDCDWVIANIPSSYDSVAVTIYPSRGGTSDNRNGEYTLEGGTPITVNAAGNTTEVAEFDFIARPTDGEVLIEMDIPSGSVASYINGMYLRLK